MLLVMFAFQTIGLVLALAVMWHVEGLFRAWVANGVPAIAEPASS